MKPYCIVPFVHMFNNSTLETSSICCVSRQYHKDTADNNLQKLWSSDYYKDIRRRMLDSNSKLPECSTCIDLEKVNQKSDRQYYIERFQDYDLQFNIDTGNQHNHPIDFDLRPGNLCNLSCRMCSPINSSQLNKEFNKHKTQFKDLYQKTNPKGNLEEFKFLSKTKDGCSWDSQENIDYIKQCILSNQVNQIKFLGGEPTLMPSVIEFLDFMIENNCLNIELFFTTNCTNDNKQFLERLAKFKKVRMHFSIDGSAKTLEYIRYPANWKKISSIIENYTMIVKPPRHARTNVECNTTVQAYNISNLRDYLYWLKATNEKLQKFIAVNFIMLRYPNALAYNVLPLDFRNKYLEQLYNDPIMQSEEVELSNVKRHVELMLDDTTVADTSAFKEFAKTFDKIRNQHIKDYIPELADIVYK